MLNHLRAHIRTLEGVTRPKKDVLSLGIEEIDQALPWNGLPLNCLHQILGDQDQSGAATVGFVIAIATRLKNRGITLWCSCRHGSGGTLYAPGLNMMGLGEEDLLVARCKNNAEVLWTMEEGLRCAAVAVVIGETENTLTHIAERRLHLAAAAGFTTGFLIQPKERTYLTTSCTSFTRWRVKALPSALTPWTGLASPCWRLNLDRCRGAPTQCWDVEWCHEACCFHLASPLYHRLSDKDKCGTSNGTVQILAK